MKLNIISFLLLLFGVFTSAQTKMNAAEIRQFTNLVSAESKKTKATGEKTEKKKSKKEKTEKASSKPEENKS